MVTQIYIGTDKLDLFKDENIVLKSSIADVADITKNTTDFTKAFTVPATNTNNLIFKHYYDANIDGGFDARIKVSGKIQLDGASFKIGKFRLNRVSIKNGQPSSYNINFWGNLVALKDILKNDELSILDLSAYDHDYNSTNVKTGLTSSLFSGDMIYTPFVKKQLYYNADGSDETQTDVLSNIAYGGGGGSGLLWSDLRPSITLISLIEAIETDYGITFSRDFFGRTEFSSLYMWLNPDSGGDIVSEALVVDFDGGNDVFMNLTTNIGSYHSENKPRQWWRQFFVIEPSTGYDTVEYTVTMYANDNETADSEFEEYAKWTSTGRKTFERSLRWFGAGTDWEIYYTVKASQEFKFTSTLKQERRDYFGEDGTVYTTSSEQTIESNFVSSLNVPKIKIIDFLKGLFKMFKLVLIPLEDGSIYVNTLIDYYLDGQVINITPYVDTNNFNVSRGELLNEIVFGYKDPTTILNTQFEKNTGLPYGNEQTYIYDENGILLDGSSLNYEVPFEQFVYERLTDINDDVQTNFQYAAIVDEDINPQNPKPHIFYNVNQSIDTKKIGFINDVTVKEDLGSFINLPSYTEAFEDSGFSTLFSEEFNTWDGSLISNTLYSNYHQNYILSIFNVKRRNFKYKAKNFPLRFLTQLSLNDVIQIKSDYFRIDNFELNLLTGEVDFELINSFDNSVAGFFPDQTDIFATYEAQSVSVYVVGLSNYSTTKVDEGSGTGWITVTDNGSSSLIFAFDELEEIEDRAMTITVINDDTLQEFDISATQSGNPVRSLRMYLGKNTQYIPLIT